jgi:4-hydroxy-3-methylbut-2-enyl diphosphate reductase
LEKVILAKSAGFCFGVQRAVDTVYDLIGKGGGEPIYTYGPIIHNEEVVQDLERKGVNVIDFEHLKTLPKGARVVIRSHGVSKAVYDAIEESGAEIVEATCPFVLKIHRIVQKESKEGSQIVIIGDENHPEVQGIMGWCTTKPLVADTAEKAANLELDCDRRICVVSQTTFNFNKFKELVEIIRKKGYNTVVSNTICNATEERQAEAREIAKQVDAMIVIGSMSSSNTRKLYEICEGECGNTCYIQTISDLDLSVLAMKECIGITAGASTPRNIIEEVYTNVRGKL